MSKVRKLLMQVEPGTADAQALLSRLATDFPPEVVSANINKLLTATVPMKHGDRPDPNAIGVALRILLAYRIGEPVKRIAHADMTPRETDGETQERLDRSPAARASMAAMLADTPEGRAAMEAALGGRVQKNTRAEIIEAEPGDGGAEG